MSRDTTFFWSGLEDHELLVQECDDCATRRHPPRPVCATCGASGWKPHRSAGNGRIYSYTVVHHPPVPGRTMPYPVALVELDEGVRILAPLDGVADGDTPEIGATVEAAFEGGAGEVALVWRLRGATTAAEQE